MRTGHSSQWLPAFRSTRLDLEIFLGETMAHYLPTTAFSLANHTHHFSFPLYSNLGRILHLTTNAPPQPQCPAQHGQGCGGRFPTQNRGPANRSTYGGRSAPYRPSNPTLFHQAPPLFLPLGQHGRPAIVSFIVFQSMPPARLFTTAIHRTRFIPIPIIHLPHPTLNPTRYETPSPICPSCVTSSPPSPSPVFAPPPKIWD